MDGNLSQIIFKENNGVINHFFYSIDQLLQASDQYESAWPQSEDYTVKPIRSFQNFYLINPPL